MDDRQAFALRRINDVRLRNALARIKRERSPLARTFVGFIYTCDRRTLKRLEPKEPSDTTATKSGLVLAVKRHERFHVGVVETNAVVGDLESNNVALGVGF